MRKDERLYVAFLPGAHGRNPPSIHPRPCSDLEMPGDRAFQEREAGPVKSTLVAVNKPESSALKKRAEDARMVESMEIIFGDRRSAAVGRQ